MRLILLIVCLLGSEQAGAFVLGTPQVRPSSATQTAAAATPTIARATAYPVARGSETDSRKIIAAGGPKLSAILVSHCLFATEPLAEAALLQIMRSEADFATLTASVSACTETRDAQGLVGWINVHEEDPSNDEHLDLIFPHAARTQLLNMVTKPGDVVLIESVRGHHLVQIVDVMADVRQASVLKKRKHPNQYDPIISNDLTFQMETMGCQMNAADSERMQGQLLDAGIRPHAGEAEERLPDVIVLNTCSIRDHAEQKVYSYLGPHAKRKREGGNVTIIVAGCVAQQEGAALLQRVPEIDLVLGPQYANRIGDLLEDVYNGNQVVATSATHIMEDSTKPRRASKTCAWVNIIYGCNERCAFCIVPTTRGVEQSRPVESIVKEVTELVQSGYKEITLLGQNIDAYGRDMSPKKKFSDLIRTVGSVEGLERLRFVTSHPRYMSMGVVDAVAETRAACESFHIPFQSGSNEILSTMGRGHTREKYKRIVDRIRKRIPDASITADVIVGFPGETEEDFQQTLNLMEEVVFDSVNTAAYSPRPNTPAAAWDNQIEHEVKQERLQRINKINLQHAKQRRARMMKRTIPVLIEERNVKKPTQVMGRSRHGYIVYCDGDIDELRGQTVTVKIDTCETYYLSGTRVEK